MSEPLDTQAEHLLVIGGGQAAAQLIEVARQEGFTGRITLVTDEDTPPYQRPPLSKTYLVGSYSVDWLLYRPMHFYDRFNVDLILGRRAAKIDPAAKEVLLDDGTKLGYDKLALTLGGRARKLSVPGHEHPAIFYIRTLADVKPLQAKLRTARRIIVVGAGFIGLEAAAALVQQGFSVEVLAAQDRIIPRVLTGDMSGFLLDQHLLHGVRIHLNTNVVGFDPLPDGSVAVCCADGKHYPADIVIAGIGAHPNVELAAEAGLDCEDGIIVDELGTTNDPDIYAAGDCTNHPNNHVGRRLRLETVHNAVEQGRTVGLTIAGKNEPYNQTPWVWSDQYALRIQSVGIASGYDQEILRGDPSTGQFSIFYFNEGNLLAVNTINQPKIFGAVRRLLNGRIPLTPSDAADENYAIEALAKTPASLEFEIPWPHRWDKAGAAINWGH